MHDADSKLLNFSLLKERELREHYEGADRALVES